MTGPVLEVADLSKTFAGFRAVTRVSFAVAAGELVALIGPNGAGKTTTFNMINGQLRPDTGHVHLEKRDITGVSPQRLWRLGVARTFQITATFPSLTVAENLMTALVSRDQAMARLARPHAHYRDEAMSLLDEIGMIAAADRVCGVLAYGDLKRVELALALTNKPRLLLMDEPTAGMAPKERNALMTLVTRLAQERRTAILFTEHDMDAVFRHAHRILVMNRGELIAVGSPNDIRANPMVREVYLGHGATSGSA